MGTYPLAMMALVSTTPPAYRPHATLMAASTTSAPASASPTSTRETTNTQSSTSNTSTTITALLVAMITLTCYSMSRACDLRKSFQNSRWHISSPDIASEQVTHVRLWEIFVFPATDPIFDLKVGSQF